MIANPQINAKPQPLRFPYKTLLSVVRNTPLRRGLTRRKIFPIFKNNIQHPVMTDFRGVPIILRFDNTTECKALFGFYDLKELSFMKGACKTDAPVFVDIGANSGFYTQNFLALGKGKALAIEPNPDMRKRVTENYNYLKQESSGRCGQLILEPYAIGKDGRDAYLDLSEGYGAANIKDNKPAKAIKVKIKPLEEVLAKHKINKIDVLKIDVEGFEDRALMPFFENVNKTLFPKRIIMEHTSQNEWQGDLLGLLKSCGYSIALKTRGNLLLERIS